MTKKIAVVLAGCGVFDGSEINEVVLTLLALEEQGVKYQCYAPNIEYTHVLNHITGVEQDVPRNVLEESARIVRGNVKDLMELDANDYDSLIMTGGFGVAKNLSSFAFDGEKLTIHASVIIAMKAFTDAGKPSGYMCIAPVLLPKVFAGVGCTIGHDPDTAKVITELGGAHIDCEVDGIVVDAYYKIVSTPAYMLATSITEAKSGIDKLVKKVCELH